MLEALKALSYYAMVNSIDEQFGRIMNKPKELHLDDNTLIIFTSDHGEMFTSQGNSLSRHFGCQRSYGGGLRNLLESVRRR